MGISLNNCAAAVAVAAVALLNAPSCRQSQMSSAGGDRARLTFVMGTQWGDEGKGKLVDWLAQRDGARVVCRCQGGNNAGHTVLVDGVAYDFHLLPSGVVSREATAVIGHGVVVHLPGLFAEIDAAAAKGLTDVERRLRVSDRAHLVFDFHQQIDGLQEGTSSKLGTTKKGIGPTYSSKMQRNGLRVCDLMGDWDAFCDKYSRLLAYMRDRYGAELSDCQPELLLLRRLRERLRPMVCDTVLFLSRCLQDAECHVLVEGAQSCMLDIDVGTYPYVTSSNCSVGGVCTGLGVPPQMVTQVYGVVKAYTTRVGAGAFPTELTDAVGERLQELGAEIGVTTGRRRRCGWLDAHLVRYANVVNGFRGLALTKLDVLDTFEEVKIGVGYSLDGKELDGMPALAEDLARVEVKYLTLPGWRCSVAGCRSFEELPPQAQQYVLAVEQHCAVPVLWVGVGPSRECIVTRS